MIIDCNMHHLPEDLFTNEKILKGFMDCVPRTYGEHAYMGTIPGTDTRQIILEKPKGYENLNYAEGQYTLEAKLEDMEKAGIDMALLRIPVWQEWLPLDMCRIVNDGLADMVKRSGGKLQAMAILPPWGDKECLFELERCINELGMVGVQVACHYGELYLDDDIFRPYFRVLNDYKMTVDVHHTPLPVEYGSIYEYTNLRRSFGRCMAQATAVGRELMSGMFEELPDIKFMHTMLGGGFFAYVNQLFPQPSSTEEVMDRFDSDNDKYRRYLKNNLYFDMSCAPMWGKEQLECAVKVFGADHVLYSSSYPVRREWMLTGVDCVRELDISEEEKEQILCTNAQKLFNIG